MVVYVFAPWCTTCKQQEVIIDKIMHNSRFDKVRYYVVDFDNDKDSMRKLKANTRSTNSYIQRQARNHALSQ